MAFPTSRSSTRRLAPWTYRLTRDEEKEQYFIFTFDDEWFTAYGRLVDAFSRIVRKYNLPDDDFEALCLLASPGAIVDVMMHEDIQDYSLSEHMTDEAHELFGEAVTGDFLEELVNFINSIKKPEGYQLVLDIIRRNKDSDDYFCLADFEGFREKDSQVYTLQYYS